MLSVQGSSKLCLMLGHAAWVFQVLAKAGAVPSTTPLIALKSSVWRLLKFPQRPLKETKSICMDQEIIDSTLWTETWQTLCLSIQYFLPHVFSLKDGSRWRYNCMIGMSWTTSWRPVLLPRTMKEVEGLKMVTLAMDKEHTILVRFIAATTTQAYWECRSFRCEHGLLQAKTVSSLQHAYNHYSRSDGTYSSSLA